ncbi:hypothetical protein [Sphingomonas panni]|nr:hypothetical protein [Sphingomonas panni]
MTMIGDGSLVRALSNVRLDAAAMPLVGRPTGAMVGPGTLSHGW